MWTWIILGLLLALYAYIIITTVCVVVMENRQPVKTIAWIVVIVSLPFTGLILFYFFGQSLRKERYISRKSVNMLTQRAISEFYLRQRISSPPEYKPLIHFFEDRCLSYPFQASNINFYSRGLDFIDALIEKINAAVHHVHLETYIFEDDNIGRRLRDCLVAAAQRGVIVRLIYDDVGCWSVKQKFFDDMALQGVHIQNFMPVRFPRFTHKINYRNHRKICVIDGNIGFIGGMNIAKRYVLDEGEQLWRDCHLSLNGGGVYALQSTFLIDWMFISREMITDPKYFPPLNSTIAQGIIQIVTSSPVNKWANIMMGLTWAISNAKNYIYIQSPYFMPTESVLQALQTAAMSGIDVRLMLPKKPDARFLRLANCSFFSDVLRAGVKILLFSPGFLHSKTIVIDDAMCSVGSTNMDFRSFENNFESNAFIYDKTTAIHVRSIFEADAEHCTYVNMSKWSKRPRIEKIKESFIRLFSPLL